MKIEKNKVVVIVYEVKVDGTVVDKMTEDRPLDYIHGGNMLLPKFEEVLEGKEEGYEFGFSLGPADAYGEYDGDRIVEIPKTAFVVDGKLHDEVLAIGNMVPMYNGEGQVVPGKVTGVKDEVVVMDFNHPMAGKTLDFSGKVLSVRDVTEKELKEGLHGEYLPHEGGCHCGGHCKGGCHEDGGCHGDEGCHGEGNCHGEGESCGCCHDDGKEGRHGKGGCHGDEA